METLICDVCGQELELKFIHPCDVCGINFCSDCGDTENSMSMCEDCASDYEESNKDSD